MSLLKDSYLNNTFPPQLLTTMSTGFQCNWIVAERAAKQRLSLFRRYFYGHPETAEETNIRKMEEF